MALANWVSGRQEIRALKPQQAQGQVQVQVQVQFWA